MFNNARHALEWAYSTSGKQIVKMSGINRMRGESSGTQNMLLVGLDSYEIHGQAGAIIGMVKRLTYPAQIEYINAQFGRKLDRDDLKVLIYQGCEALGLSLDKTDAVYQMLRGYFHPKRGLSNDATRRILGCRFQYAVLARRGLYDMLEHIHDRSMADLTEIFRQHGLIKETAASV